jgi:hypothetical protein
MKSVVMSQKSNLDSLGIGLLLLIALGIFLIYDLIAALSVHLQFTLAYTIFWVVLGALLLRRTPRQLRLSLLILFVGAMITISLINWDSRKPFLRHFYQVEVGMTATQADQVMQGYMKFISPMTQVNERGEILAGPVSYRHTEEGWGDSDVGLLIFKNGRVVETDFYPD